MTETSKHTMNLNWVEKLLKGFFLLLIGIYRTLGTQFFGGNCRFLPSCSQYAVECFQNHPPLKALQLSTKRICSCRPGGPFGYDPVPQRKFQ